MTQIEEKYNIKMPFKIYGNVDNASIVTTVNTYMENTQKEIKALKSMIIM